MHLPINISDLLRDSIVESDRLELKANWNPEAVLHTICAFANDFNNFGGGYIVIGVEEENGKPILPPKGIDPAQADKILRELVRVCSFLKPTYTPITSIENLQGKNVLVIWVPGGQSRPYTAPVTLGKGKETKYYYIRKASTTVTAKNEELRDLLALANVPFDDRINHHATLEDLKLPLIQSFLKEVGSKLLEESRRVSFIDLCRQMALIDGGNEYLKPRNIGLLLFNDQPDKFFPYAQIDVVYFPDGEGGDRIQEEIFKGPLDHQLRSALRHIQNSFISEKILKLPDRAEAQRFFNYPYSAIEEALVNAVYHRSYEIREPIEVRITPECIRILSYPGADPSIPLTDLQNGQCDKPPLP
jgi:ATP-dependent DNA helicase RecG